MFSIFYSARVVHGCTARDWRDAPDQDVQVVVEWREPLESRREFRWYGVTDRVLWTGEDTYDPFGWGMKYGAWTDRVNYDAIWERAAHGR